MLPELIASHDLLRKLSAEEFLARAPRCEAEPQFLEDLRRWRRREMVRIAWRDLAGWAQLEETLADLTAFADAAISVACEFARRGLVARYGEPCSDGGVVQPLVVVGMGKLGGGELNFSSDVDLVLLISGAAR